MQTSSERTGTAKKGGISPPSLPGTCAHTSDSTHTPGPADTVSGVRQVTPQTREAGQVGTLAWGQAGQLTWTCARANGIEIKNSTPTGFDSEALKFKRKLRTYGQKQSLMAFLEPFVLTERLLLMVGDALWSGVPVR